MKGLLFFSGLNLVTEKNRTYAIKWVILIFCLFCGFNIYSQNGTERHSTLASFFAGYDVTGTNPNCYICHAIEELTEDAIIGGPCVINSTALVTMETGNYSMVSVMANGIKLTDGTKAVAGCWSLFKCVPFADRLNAPIYEEEIFQIDLNESITISPGELDGFEIYHWYDNEGNLIFQGKDLHIANAVEEKYTLRVIDADGFIGYKDVEIKLKPNRLETLFPNPANTGNLNIKYKINEANSAYIMIFSYYMSGGISNNYIVDMNVNEKNIDISNLPFGLYKVALVTDGQIVDVKILSKL